MNVSQSRHVYGRISTGQSLPQWLHGYKARNATDNTRTKTRSHPCTASCYTESACGHNMAPVKGCQMAPAVAARRPTAAMQQHNYGPAHVRLVHKIFPPKVTHTRLGRMAQAGCISRQAVPVHIFYLCARSHDRRFSQHTTVIPLSVKWVGALGLWDMLCFHELLTNAQTYETMLCGPGACA